MTKNIEDLLYRGDSLERMGEMSGRLREDSKKYKKAAVRINWELMLKQVSKMGALHRMTNMLMNNAVRSFRRSWFDHSDLPHLEILVELSILIEETKA